MSGSKPSLARHKPHPLALAQLHGIEQRWPPRALCARRRHWAQVEQGDLWRADGSGHELVYLFRRPERMPRAVEKARAGLKPGA